MILALSWEITAAGLGAILLGVGSVLSGWAALRRAKDEHIEKEEAAAVAEMERHEDTKQSIDGN